MRLSRKALVWIGLLLAGLLLIGAGVSFGVTRLNDADKWGSVIGGLVALLGLPATLYGIVLARRSPLPGGQSVTDSTIDGRLVQARNIKGNLRIGLGSPASAPAPFRATATESAPPAPHGQRVTRSYVAGPAHQVDGVGGDADIDR